MWRSFPPFSVNYHNKWRELTTGCYFCRSWRPCWNSASTCEVCEWLQSLLCCLHCPSGLRVFAVFWVLVIAVHLLNCISVSLSDQKHPDVPEELFTCVQTQTVSQSAEVQLNRWKHTVCFCDVTATCCMIHIFTMSPTKHVIMDPSWLPVKPALPYLWLVGLISCIFYTWADTKYC